jgi:hypothetical protein
MLANPDNQQLNFTTVNSLSPNPITNHRTRLSEADYASNHARAIRPITIRPVTIAFDGHDPAADERRIGGKWNG